MKSFGRIEFVPAPTPPIGYFGDVIQRAQRAAAAADWQRRQTEARARKSSLELDSPASSDADR